MAQFVAEDAFRDYYRSFADAYEENLKRAADAGDIRDGDCEVWSWALIGMTVFLGMRFADWDEQRPVDEQGVGAVPEDRRHDRDDGQVEAVVRSDAGHPVATATTAGARYRT